MSVLFDALWWWRSEYAGTSNPYVGADPPCIIAGPAAEQIEPIPLPQVDSNFGAFNDSTFDFNQVPNWLLNFSDVPGWQWEPSFSWPNA
jgi:hypothetical protein